jgi:hypothetical protein
MRYLTYPETYSDRSPKLGDTKLGDISPIGYVTPENGLNCFKSSTLTAQIYYRFANLIRSFTVLILYIKYFLEILMQEHVLQTQCDRCQSRFPR